MSNAYSIQAKQTLYNGIYYRSKLEAQWAVIFDVLNITTVYEPERFTGLDGLDYLPDFYFPQCNLYAEVKATDEQLFESQVRISSVLCNKSSPIANSLGILLLGPIPYSEEIHQDCILFGDCLYFDFEKEKIISDVFQIYSIGLESPETYDASNLWFYRDLLKSIGEDREPRFTSVYPEIPQPSTIKMFLDKGRYDTCPTALYCGLTTARRARFDFDDSFHNMVKDGRNIIGGSL